MAEVLQTVPNLVVHSQITMEGRFELVAVEGGARAGRLHLLSGRCLDTPAFLPVGTLGAPKAILIEEFRKLGYEAFIANAFHLYLRPGLEVIERCGGLNAFAGWDGILYTDSGGYQLFSLEVGELKEEGVQVRSPYDGSYHFLTPEKVVEIQVSLGADVFFPLDICPPYPAEEEQLRMAVERSACWLQRSLSCEEARRAQQKKQWMVPVIQGGVSQKWREHSLRLTTDIFPSRYVAIGGLSVGEPVSLLYSMTRFICSLLPRDTARHLLGVGTPVDILECIAAGVDTFDCVIPTRNGRRGLIYTWEGIINIHNERWKYDTRPLDTSEMPPHPVSTAYSRAFVRHLFKAGELLGMIIATVHNLAFYRELMRTARQKIIEGRFTEWKEAVLPKLTCRL